MKQSEAVTAGPVVAIDGPAGAGKSTLARRLAKSLGLPYINTGMMYRALTRAAVDRSIDVADGARLSRLARTLHFSLTESSPPELLLAGPNEETRLMSADVEALVSAVSAHPEVRAVLRTAQRALGRHGAVMEGRDIATAVFPDATTKIYVTAAHSERARRRARERGGNLAAGADLEHRDTLDAQTTAPFPAPGAAVLDTTYLSEDEAFSRALQLIRLRQESDSRAR